MSASADDAFGQIRAMLGDTRDSAPAAQPQLARVAELFVVLANQMMQMEETIAEQFPRKLLPGGEANEQQGLSREIIRQYLSLSDSDPRRAQLQAEIERHLTGLGYRMWSVVKSMESLPRRYAKTRAPSAIEEAPEMTAGGALFRSDAKYRKYWDKYVELCGGRDGGTLVKTLSDLHSQILVEILQARFGTSGKLSADTNAANTNSPAPA